MRTLLKNCREAMISLVQLLTKWLKEKNNSFQMYKIPISFLCLIIFLGCANYKKMNRLEAKNFDKEGHRGCRGLRPENTIPAMLHALELGVTTLETDIVITKDKKLVLSHEPFFNHEISTKPDGTLVTEAEERSLNRESLMWECVHTQGFRHNRKWLHTNHY
jgi:hypothetical protein